MKKSGILNGKLSRIIAAMGHTDKLVVCDCGLPIPRNAVMVDLALTNNIPSFRDTLMAILNELHVEKAIIAEEMATDNPDLHTGIPAMLEDIKVQSVSHEKFKQITREENNIAFVRTGEATPYANIILISGVNFG